MHTLGEKPYEHCSACRLRYELKICFVLLLCGYCSFLFSLVLQYREGVDMLREAGIDMNYDEDLR